jgi:hypothetical protein
MREISKTWNIKMQWRERGEVQYAFFAADSARNECEVMSVHATRMFQPRNYPTDFD